MLIRILSPEKFVHIKDACRYYGIEYEEVAEEVEKVKNAIKQTSNKTK